MGIVSSLVFSAFSPEADELSSPLEAVMLYYAITLMARSGYLVRDFQS